VIQSSGSGKGTAGEGGNQGERSAKTYYPNVFQVFSSLGEISLLFGSASKAGERHGEIPVRGACRIVMNPFAAKRLAVALDRAISEHESECGGPEKDDFSGTLTHPGAMARPELHDCSPGGITEEARHLLQLVKSLNVEVGFERSLKITKGILLNNRFLLGVDKKQLGTRAEDRLTEACKMIGMPATLLDVFLRHLSRGNYVHFGFEQNEETMVHKVYLEFWENIREEIEKIKRRPGAALLHLGLKWDVADPSKQSLTRYTWYPWLSPREILLKVSGVLDPQEGAPFKDAAGGLVSLALARIPYHDILYLEVTEEGNPRLSFDINVYRANLQVAEVYPILSMLCRRHSVAYDAFHSIYEDIKTKRFGHLAAGVDRKGNEFFTVYYGVESIPAG